MLIGSAHNLATDWQVYEDSRVLSLQCLQRLKECVTSTAFERRQPLTHRLKLFCCSRNLLCRIIANSYITVQFNGIIFSPPSRPLVHRGREKKTSD